jgi:excisionase family DNA binding protein
MDMAEEQMSLLKARDAARYLNVSLATLDRIEKERKLTPFRTPGGHRRYSLAMLNEYLERSRQRFRSASPSIKHAKSVQGGKPQNGTVRILVVDSEPDTVELIIRALRADSDVYEFASASNGYEVGVQVMAFKPDLIVLSIAGPETDGFEVCEKIKGDPETAYIRIVGIVGFTEDRKIGEMLRCGIDDYLIKPFQIEELQQSVRYLTSRKAAIDRASRDDL